MPASRMTAGMDPAHRPTTAPKAMNTAVTAPRGLAKKLREGGDMALPLNRARDREKSMKQQCDAARGS